MAKLYISEKPVQSQVLIKTLGKEGDVFMLAPSIINFKFKYPSYLSYKDYPFSNKLTEYKLMSESKLFEFPFKIITSNGVKDIENISSKKVFDLLTQSYIDEYKLAKERNKLIDYFQQFDEIIVATNADYTGTRAFDLYVSDFLNHHFELNKNVTRIWINSFDEVELIKSFNEREDINRSEKNNKARDYYKNKDFFSYNFNINSLMIFDDMLKKVGSYSDDILLTYNMLQTLLLLKNKIKQKDLLIKMENVRIGTVASRAVMLETLFEFGLIKIIKKSNGDNLYILTEESFTLLNLIHNKIKSITPEKLQKDLSMEHEDFKDKYSRKIATYFKKQRNYFRNKTKY